MRGTAFVKKDRCKEAKKPFPGWDPDYSLEEVEVELSLDFEPSSEALFVSDSLDFPLVDARPLPDGERWSVA
jgi:hypothetical protein